MKCCITLGEYTQIKESSVKANGMPKSESTTVNFSMDECSWRQKYALW